MAELQELDIVIKPDGEVKIEVRGVKGEKCLDITRRLEELLGGEVIDRTHTDEYYQSEGVSHRRRIEES